VFFLRWSIADALYVVILICCLFYFVILGGIGKMGTRWGWYGEVERT